LDDPLISPCSLLLPWQQPKRSSNLNQQQPSLMSQSNSPPISGGSTSSIGDPAIFGVVTVSDRASSGVYEDLSGPAILQFFQEAVASPWTAQYVVVPDEQPVIEATLKDLVRDRACTGKKLGVRQQQWGLGPLRSVCSTLMRARTLKLARIKKAMPTYL
jgi:hypothetical protein